MLVIVKDQGRFSSQRFDQLHEGLDLAVVYFMHGVILVIQRAVGKLQKLVAECRGAGYTDVCLIFRKLKDHGAFQIVVCLSRFYIQLHRHLVVDDIRKLQIIFGLHADADIRDPVQDALLTSRLCLVAVNHAVRSPLIRLEVPLPELRVSLPEAFAAIQKIHLAPQIIQSIR